MMSKSNRLIGLDGATESAIYLQAVDIIKLFAKPSFLSFRLKNQFLIAKKKNLLNIGKSGTFSKKMIFFTSFLDHECGFAS